MMFKKENFEYDGMYLMYNLKPGQHYGNNEFVARFKYVKFAGAFKNFLIKHFTTDEYFGRYKAGESPLDILESNLPNINRILLPLHFFISSN